MLKPYQKVNKFPKASALTLKANLWSNFYRMQQKFGAAAFDHMPPTCILPNQLELLEARRHSRMRSSRAAPPAPPTEPQRRSSQEWSRSPANANAIWIIKPAAACCGKGINQYRAVGSCEEVKVSKGVACRYPIRRTCSTA